MKDHKKLRTKYLALDLEMSQPSGKIIQIGAVVGDIVTGQVIERFSAIVNPNEELSEYIITLTGITQEQVDRGVSLFDAYHDLKALHLKHDAFINPITWGGGDSAVLREQLCQISNNVWSIEDKWCFGRRWIDAKTLFVSWRIANGSEIQGGLSKAMVKVGLTFEGRKHDAGNDALNTFRIYHALLQKLKNAED